MKLSRLFLSAAILLSDIMCIYITYNYCAMAWKEPAAVNSAPAWISLLAGIPFLIGIGVCALLSRFFRKRSENH